MTQKKQTNAAKEEPVKETTAAESTTELRDELQPYFDSHPGIDAFYVTSDGQPFYEKQWAIEHQKTIDPTLEITTVTR